MTLLGGKKRFAGLLVGLQEAVTETSKQEGVIQAALEEGVIHTTLAFLCNAVDV